MAAAVRHRLPVVLLLHPTDTLQDAAGHLTDAGEDGGLGASIAPCPCCLTGCFLGVLGAVFFEVPCGKVPSATRSQLGQQEQRCHHLVITSVSPYRDDGVLGPWHREGSRTVLGLVCSSRALSPDLLLSPVPHCCVQGLLGIQDLGQVFFEPIKDKQGNILIVTLKEVKTNQTFESVRWVPICKLQTSRKSVSSPEEPTALDTLLISVQVLLHNKRAG